MNDKDLITPKQICYLFKLSRTKLYFLRLKFDTPQPVPTERRRQTFYKRSEWEAFFKENDVDQLQITTQEREALSKQRKERKYNKGMSASLVTAFLAKKPIPVNKTTVVHLQERHCQPSERYLSGH